MKNIRILLADDHAVLRAGLRALLSAERDLEVVGEASNGREAVALAQELEPDVVVMDLAMPEMSGMEATRHITASCPRTRVLALTMHAEEQYLLELLQGGGSGYVLKRSADTELLEAIRAVSRGEAFLYPGAVKLLLAEYSQNGPGSGAGPGQAGHRPRHELSEREDAVLRLTAEGYSNQEIAAKLAISAKTVDTYRQRIMEKLDLHHRAELVRYALDRGLLHAQR